MFHPFGICSLFFERFLVLMILCYVGGARNTEELLCPTNATVDLTFATSNSSGFLVTVKSTELFFPREKSRYVNGAWRGCICELKPCLPLCPPLKNGKNVAENFTDYAATPKIYTTNLTVEEDDETTEIQERFNLLISNPNCKGRPAYFLDPEKHEGDAFYLLKNGTLLLPVNSKPENRILDFRQFCLRQRPNQSFYTPKICSLDTETDEFRTVKYVGALFAVPFVIATILVYSVLPELRNIHGTTLRCYLCCLVVTYVALAIDRIPPRDDSVGVSCLCLGFTIYFSFLASFFWLNVMCLDMWWRFGGFGSLTSSGRQHDRKKFIGYSIYAWGSAVTLTAICISMEFSPGISPSIVRPGFTSNACWFSTRTAAALYYFGPVSVLIASNIYLFISTSIKMVQHKRNTQSYLNNGDSKSHNDDKLWFGLHLKLSVIMGVSWSTEVISWLWEDPKYLWYVTDMVNALQGIFIFLIFVWKKKIWQSLRKRYGQLSVTPQGCIFASRNSESPATTASLDHSPNVRCNVSVFVMEEVNNHDNGESRKNTDPP